MDTNTNHKTIPERKENGQFFDPMAVTWTENYNDLLTKIWLKLPRFLTKILITLAIFMLGISINGDWINIIVHMGRQFGFISRENTFKNTAFKWSEISLESLRLKGVLAFCLFSNFYSYLLYFGIGGILHWYFYVRQRDRAEEWKCQPNNWLSPDLEKHEITLGSFTLFVNATLSGMLSCYIYNGGYSTVYYDVADYGYLWLFLQWPVIFVYQDYVTYWIHRINHMPFFYKHIHKLHHKYKQPTAFSVTAMHPLEALSVQSSFVLPIFFVPTHWVTVYSIALYVYYHGIIDHSGINFKAFWWQPWQPDAIFHDNHHQYFHVNFGFNIYYWDILHGTYRRKDRVYHENIYYGKGKSLDEVTNEELQTDLAERDSENPLAYRDNKLEFQLTKADLNALTKSKLN